MPHQIDAFGPSQLLYEAQLLGERWLQPDIVSLSAWMATRYLERAINPLLLDFDFIRGMRMPWR